MTAMDTPFIAITAYLQFTEQNALLTTEAVTNTAITSNPAATFTDTETTILHQDPTIPIQEAAAQIATTAVGKDSFYRVVPHVEIHLPWGLSHYTTARYHEHLAKPQKRCFRFLL